MFVQANAAQKKKRARAATGVLESSGVLCSDAVMIWSGSFPSISKCQVLFDRRIVFAEDENAVSYAANPLFRPN
jgi:hypothetical protein